MCKVLWMPSKKGLQMSSAELVSLLNSFNSNAEIQTFFDNEVTAKNILIAASECDYVAFRELPIEVIDELLKNNKRLLISKGDWVARVSHKNTSKNSSDFHHSHWELITEIRLMSVSLPLPGVKI